MKKEKVDGLMMSIILFMFFALVKTIIWLFNYDGTDQTQLIGHIVGLMFMIILTFGVCYVYDVKEYLIKKLPTIWKAQKK